MDIKHLAMKFAFFLLFPLWLSGAQPDSLEKWFQIANDQYKQGNYEQAVSLYERILQQGMESGALYFNLGNAYYKLQRWGKARLNYERAARLIPSDEALQTNLALLKSKLVDKIPEPPVFILEQWWRAFLNSASLSFFSWLLLALWFALLLVLALHIYWLRVKGQKKYQSALIVLGLLFLLNGVVTWQKYQQIYSTYYGVITADSVTLYAEPSTGGTEVFVLHQGTKVKIKRKENNWLEVRLSDGKTGWIQSRQLEII